VNLPERKKTRKVFVGKVAIGEEAPIVIQSMTNTKTANFAATIEQIINLEAAGCELVRVAVPDHESVAALEMIVSQSPIPVIADIHFDHQLALAAIAAGAAKIRINPGNIGGTEKFLEVAKSAEAAGIPLRIGVNAGSLEKKLLDLYRHKPAEALFESALSYVNLLEKINFSQIVVSLKSSAVYTTIEANRLFAANAPYPLHLGVTEAGPLETGSLKAAIGIGTLLAEGIGDTFRVSLTANPAEEIRVAREILQALGIRIFRPELISCPTCGRCETDLVQLTNNVEEIISKLNLPPLRIAVMGCAVNGPGEAREADLGICVGKKQGLVFRKGKVVKTIKLEELLDAFLVELEAERQTFCKRDKEN
jgi:(E)-4-hydroxy-3-methylbut-2-enyl-diphosphate synthase